MRKLKDIRDEFQARYPSKPELQVQALADAVDQMMIQSGVMLKPYGSRSFKLDRDWLDGIYPSTPRVFREFVETVMESMPTQSLESFLISSMSVLVDHQKSAGGSLMVRDGLGQQLFIQAAMRNERPRIDLVQVLTPVLRQYVNFQANPSIGHTLIWVLGQAPAYPLDVVMWLEVFLPCFGKYATSSAATLQTLALEYIRLWSEKYVFAIPSRPNINCRVDLIPQALMRPFLIKWDTIESLLLAAYSSNSVLLESKKGLEYIPQLQSMYQYLRDKLVHPRSLLSLDFDESFQRAWRYLSTKDDILLAELKNFVLLVLCRSRNGYKLLADQYHLNIAQTAILLRSLDERWGELRGKIDTVELQYSLAKIKALNAEWLASFRNTPAVLFH
jgi:hypothetical protein